MFFDICRGVIGPCVALSFVASQADIPLGYLALPCHAFAIVLFATARIMYSNWIQSWEAGKLGAVPIRRVVGKWPGNVDVLFSMMRSFKTSYLADPYLNLFQEYQCTTLNLRILWVDQIISMDRDHSKFVLTSGFDHFWRGNAQKERMETFLGDGIFNRDNETWKMHRSMARPFFSRDRISDFEIFERYTTTTLAILSSLASSNQPCDAQDLYARFTLDTASEFLFGRNLDTLSSSLPVPNSGVMGAKGSSTSDSWGSFTQAFEEIQLIITRRRQLGNTWPLFELLGDRTMPHVMNIRKFLDPIVERVLLDKQTSEKAGTDVPIDQRTFLQHLADSTEDASLIRDQILNILLASRDTTASLLTYITYFLAIHPDVTKKLRAEVLEHCGTNGAPTYDNIRHLRYMRAVINETLRIFPPVPLNMRESRKEACVLPTADPTYASISSSQHLYMPKATTFLYIPILTQRNPALWGPDADIFDPERWLDPTRLAKVTANPFMFTPFSAGPRICLGQNYAYHEASYFLVRLLQQFETFTLASDAQPEKSFPPHQWRSSRSIGRQTVEQIWPAAAITLYVKGGLWIRFGKSNSL
jgi:cytochrome P450